MASLTGNRFPSENYRQNNIRQFFKSEIKEDDNLKIINHNCPMWIIFDKNAY